MVQRRVLINPATMVVSLLALALTQGCASTGAQGPGAMACLFGGADEQAQSECQQLRWGTQGYLIAVNAAALRQLPARGDRPTCEAHVALVERALAGGAYTTQRIRSCPAHDGSGGNCHLSLEVRDAAGARYVLDDGAMLDAASFVSGVGTYEEFEKRRSGYSWEDHPAGPPLMRAQIDAGQMPAPGHEGY